MAADEYVADNWEAALARVRNLGYDVQVRLPKSEAPGLPAEMETISSNFPYSIHKGARLVYREDEPGEHVQIREYRDHWVVSLDRYNPHYEPMTHARNDVPARSLTSLPLYAGAQTFLLGTRVCAEAVERQSAVLNKGVLPAVRKVVC